jgi:integrase
VQVVRFHDLHHTAVAIMLSHGFPIFTISKIIGHARPSITSDTYGHLEPGADAEVGQMIDDLVAAGEVKVEEDLS